VISADRRAEIRRLYFAEHWRIGTIAAELGIHHDTVRQVLEVDHFTKPLSRVRPSQLDPYMDYIGQVLTQHPRLRATRIFEMIVGRGYTGSVSQTRRAVKRLRPSKPPEAYLRLSTLPGQEAQVDWGHFGHVQVGRASRPLSAFVMVLSWSRALHVLFTLDQTMESFLRGHVEAFEALGGCARTLLYDNLKTAVLERHGQAIKFHDRLLELAGHYHFQARPVGIARGNEKGRVERQIRFLRDRFFAARSFVDVDDLNAQFRTWRDEWAHARPCPGDPDKTVAEALEEERPLLLLLPEHSFECDLVRTIKSGKTPYLRFDRNDYSVPHEFVRKPLTLLASHDTVRVLDGQDEIARHVRCYDRGRTIEDKRHVAALLATKHAARETKGRDRLTAAVPRTQDFLQEVLLRGHSMGSAVQQLLRLLDEYGQADLAAAVELTLERGTPSPSSVAQVLEQERRRRRSPPPLALQLPDDPRVRDLRVTQHDLEDYDAHAKDDQHEPG